jgi:hypothetical protein
MEISSFNEDVVVAVMSERERERYCTFETCAGHHNPSSFPCGSFFCKSTGIHSTTVRSFM